MSALFSKNKNKNHNDKSKDELKNVETGEIVGEESGKDTHSGSGAFSSSGGAVTHKILKGFYVSEKSSLGNADSQYIFRVFRDANKSEVRKEVSKLFNVEVKSVKILNMPEKRRDFGKHPGSRVGFKKAIVILKEGYTIGHAR